VIYAGLRETRCGSNIMLAASQLHVIFFLSMKQYYFIFNIAGGLLLIVLSVLAINFEWHFKGGFRIPLVVDYSLILFGGFLVVNTLINRFKIENQQNELECQSCGTFLSRFDITGNKCPYCGHNDFRKIESCNDPLK
jgi:hypothetical protein